MCDPSVSVGVPAWTRARGNWQPEWLMSRFSGCPSRLPDAEFEKLFTNLPSTASWQLFKTGDSFPTVKLNLQFGILRLLIEALGPSGDASIDVSLKILARTHSSFAGASLSLCRNCPEAVARGVGNIWKT
jgi:hypothetical protein